MGMILFTQSGTFKPSDHGLSVGDAIQVLAIGGGAGGGGYATVGGSASSLGSIITAAGGTHSAFSAGTVVGVVPISSTGAYSVRYAGQGGNGWMPGYVMPASWSTAAIAVVAIRGLILPSTGYLPTTIQLSVGAAPSFLPVPLPPMVFKNTSTQGGSLPGDGKTARTDARGGSGDVQDTNQASNYSCVGGIGGYGYGAGGGGKASHYYGSTAGGGAGTLVSMNIILNASQVAASHAVTVGAGGTGYDDGGGVNGGGASGAVAVFW